MYAMKFHETEQGGKYREHYLRNMRPLLGDYYARDKFLVYVTTQDKMNDVYYPDWEASIGDAEKIIFTLCPVRNLIRYTLTFSETYHVLRSKGRHMLENSDESSFDKINTMLAIRGYGFWKRGRAIV
jgi:hypothetical protein